MGPNQHVRWEWNYANIPQDSIVNDAWRFGIAHETQIVGIIGALTNRNSHSVAGIPRHYKMRPASVTSITPHYLWAFQFVSDQSTEITDFSNGNFAIIPWTFE